MAQPIIVIGGGAAGLIAAWRAASLGEQVILLEKTDRLGTKILISGGGKCNVTHDGPLEEMLRAFRKNEAIFLRPSFYRLTNEQVIDLVVEGGIDLEAREDGRIFPTHGNAKDVMVVFEGLVNEVGVDVRLESPVESIESASGAVTGVWVNGQLIESDRVILATGGSSYPKSGTTGDGWRWAKTLGHTVTRIRPALAPIYLEEPQFSEFPGVPLRDCLLKARQNGKAFAKWRGDVLFTHHGITGPATLGISREVAEKMDDGPVQMEVDLAPDISFEILGERLRSYIEWNPREPVGAIVDPFIPRRLGGLLLIDSAVSCQMFASQVGKKSLNRLIENIKGWKLGAVHAVPMEKGEVVAGGVSLDEVDSKTMASKVCRGLYLCGEVLDVAGPVGGYNLQAAFSTGFVAAESAGMGL
jgi:predicted Rossmann fold flavoprotein